MYNYFIDFHVNHIYGHSTLLFHMICLANNYYVHKHGTVLQIHDPTKCNFCILYIHPIKTLINNVKIHQTDLIFLV